MKKVVGFVLVSVFVFMFLLGVVSAEGKWEMPKIPGLEEFISSETSETTPQVASGTDEKVANAIDNSPLLSGISYYILGVRSLDDSKFRSEYGLTSVLIIFFLVWLILFVVFSDILAAFGAFSNNAIAWIVGGALTIIAANLKIIQLIAIKGIVVTSIFGMASAFIGIILAFLAFVAISWGGGALGQWALNRRRGIAAHRGQENVVNAINLLNQAGANLAQQNQAGWWIPLVVGAVLLVIVVVLILVSG